MSSDGQNVTRTFVAGAAGVEVIRKQVLGERLVALNALEMQNLPDGVVVLPRSTK